MSTSCVDVCDVVIDRLTELGIDVGEDEDHEPILDGLYRVKFVLVEEPIPDFEI
jgi:hypothetical protein